LTTTSGAGAINLAVPLTQPVVQANWLFGGGQPVLPLVQVDDLVSQARQGSIETDDDGHATDGVHEYTIVDDTLTTFQQMSARGNAELKQFARPIINIEFASRDPKLRPGVVVHVDLTDPPISGDFIIQEVTIDQYHDESDDLTPRYRVKADSAARFNFIDLLNDLVDGSQDDSNASASGLVTTAVSMANTASTAAIAAAIAAIPATGQSTTLVIAALTGAQLVGLNSAPLLLLAGSPGQIIVPVYITAQAFKVSGAGMTNGNFAFRVRYVGAVNPGVGTTMSMGLGNSGTIKSFAEQNPPMTTTTGGTTLSGVGLELFSDANMLNDGGVVTLTITILYYTYATAGW
jgi:hypothetical protein